MKKILSLVLCFMFGLAVFLTGCGTSLIGVENKEKGIIFNGGSVAVVNDYLFYANAFKSEYAKMANGNEYNEAAKFASLNRIKLENLENATKFKSSENVENVTAKDLVGFSKTYMFAYGDQIYYISPTTEKNSENKNVFEVLTVVKVNNDGTGRKVIFTTEAKFDATKGKIVAIEYDNTAYIMIYDGENFVTIDITNGGTKVNEKKVTSVALPQEGADWNGMVYYTKDRDNEISGNDVYQIMVNGKNQEKLNSSNQVTDKATFVGRYDDRVFYTLTDSAASKTYSYAVNAEELASSIFTNKGSEIYYKEISNVTKVNAGSAMPGLKGYVFTANNKLFYKADNAVDPVGIFKAEDEETYSSAKVICIYGSYVYFATTSGLFKVSLSTKEVGTIVSEMEVTTDSFGYTCNSLEGEDVEVKDLYFFAKRVYEEDVEEKTDEKVYMYQVSAKGGEPKLVGKTIE